MNSRDWNRIASAAALVLGLVTAPAAWAQTTGSIVAWGLNDWGQCNVPAPNTAFVAVAAGHYHSLAVRADGSIVPWGRNIYGQYNVPAPNSGFVAAAAGGRHSLGLKGGTLGDLNCDGTFNGGDIDPFFACLGGGACP